MNPQKQPQVKPCPECVKNGRDGILSLSQLTTMKAVWMCLRKDCKFPIGYKNQLEYVDVDIYETDTESEDSDSELDVVIDMIKEWCYKEKVKDSENENWDIVTDRAFNLIKDKVYRSVKKDDTNVNINSLVDSSFGSDSLDDEFQINCTSVSENVYFKSVTPDKMQTSNLSDSFESVSSISESSFMKHNDQIFNLNGSVNNSCILTPLSPVIDSQKISKSQNLPHNTNLLCTPKVLIDNQNLSLSRNIFKDCMSDLLRSPVKIHSNSQNLSQKNFMTTDCISNLLTSPETVKDHGQNSVLTSSQNLSQNDSFKTLDCLSNLLSSPATKEDHGQNSILISSKNLSQNDSFKTTDCLANLLICPKNEKETTENSIFNAGQNLSQGDNFRTTDCLSNLLSSPTNVKENYIENAVLTGSQNLPQSDNFNTTYCISNLLSSPKNEKDTIQTNILTGSQNLPQSDNFKTTECLPNLLSIPENAKENFNENSLTGSQNLSPSNSFKTTDSLSSLLTSSKNETKGFHGPDSSFLGSQNFPKNVVINSMVKTSTPIKIVVKKSTSNLLSPGQTINISAVSRKTLSQKNMSGILTSPLKIAIPNQNIQDCMSNLLTSPGQNIKISSMSQNSQNLPGILTSHSSKQSEHITDCMSNILSNPGKEIKIETKNVSQNLDILTNLSCDSQTFVKINNSSAKDLKLGDIGKNSSDFQTVPPVKITPEASAAKTINPNIPIPVKIKILSNEKMNYPIKTPDTVENIFPNKAIDESDLTVAQLNLLKKLNINPEKKKVVFVQNKEMLNKIIKQKPNLKSLFNIEKNKLQKNKISSVQLSAALLASEEAFKTKVVNIQDNSRGDDTVKELRENLKPEEIKSCAKLSKLTIKDNKSPKSFPGFDFNVSVPQEKSNSLVQTKRIPVKTKRQIKSSISTKLKKITNSKLMQKDPKLIIGTENNCKQLELKPIDSQNVFDWATNLIQPAEIEQTQQSDKIPKNLSQSDSFKSLDCVPNLLSSPDTKKDHGQNSILVCSKNLSQTDSSTENTERTHQIEQIKRSLELNIERTQLIQDTERTQQLFNTQKESTHQDIIERTQQTQIECIQKTDDFLENVLDEILKTPAENLDTMVTSQENVDEWLNSFFD